MSRMYEIKEEYAELLTAWEMAESEEEAMEIMEKIEAVDADFRVKADVFARIRQSALSEAEGYEAEAKRLTEHAKAAKRRAAYLAESVQDGMMRLGITEIATGIGSWRVQTNPPAVQIFDDEAIPEQFRTPQPDKINKAEILRWYKETGEIVPGCDITRSQGVRFR